MPHQCARLSASASARRGHSKEKRTDCPLLALGLVLDGSGFVRRSEVFAGNAAEAKTLAPMLRGLASPAGSLVVMDRGIATEENLGWLVAAGYRYRVISRERARHFEPEAARPIETAGGGRVHLHKRLSEDGQEVRLYCNSEQRAEKEKGIERRFAERFKAGLQKVHEGLGRPRTHKRLDHIQERCGRGCQTWVNEPLRLTSCFLCATMTHQNVTSWHCVLLMSHCNGQTCFPHLFAVQPECA
ncbi:MAG: transposase [Gammaproteobacteria bacterium]|nr:transposase [Gammaproteobacteria bacterium]MBU1655359.1 transposase [Gammaproteobacteria bacterium]MBU1960542.1 transposase [Gammaproteobacteria bacterium]